MLVVAGISAGCSESMSHNVQLCNNNDTTDSSSQTSELMLLDSCKYSILLEKPFIFYLTNIERLLNIRESFKRTLPLCCPFCWGHSWSRRKLHWRKTMNPRLPFVSWTINVNQKLSGVESLAVKAGHSASSSKLKSVSNRIIKTLLWTSYIDGQLWLRFSDLRRFHLNTVFVYSCSWHVNFNLICCHKKYFSYKALTTTESDGALRIITGTHFDDGDSNTTKYVDDNEDDNNDGGIEVGSYLSQIDVSRHEKSAHFADQSHLYAKNTWIGRSTEVYLKLLSHVLASCDYRQIRERSVTLRVDGKFRSSLCAWLCV